MNEKEQNKQEVEKCEYYAKYGKCKNPKEKYNCAKNQNCDFKKQLKLSLQQQLAQAREENKKLTSRIGELEGELKSVNHELCCKNVENETDRQNHKIELDLILSERDKLNADK